LGDLGLILEGIPAPVRQIEQYIPDIYDDDEDEDLNGHREGSEYAIEDFQDFGEEISERTGN